MKYNPTNHSIEFDDGRLCCRLSEEVSTREAHILADSFGDPHQIERLILDNKELDSFCEDLNAQNKRLAEEIEGLEMDLDAVEREFRISKRRVNEPNSIGWWWVINPKDNFNHHPIQVFEMNDELMVQFANQTIPLSLLKEEYPYLNDFYKAYLPEY